MTSKPENFEPEIIILFCQNSVKKDVTLTDSSRRLSGLLARFVVMPCSSKVAFEHLVGLMQKGVDGIQVIRCPDRTCHFLDGNAKTVNRVKHARSMLDEIGYGSDRIGITEGRNLSTDDILNLAIAHGQAVRSLGPNPMKKN